jgi:hypothetical protein
MVVVVCMYCTYRYRNEAGTDATDQGCDRTAALELMHVLYRPQSEQLNGWQATYPELGKTSSSRLSHLGASLRSLEIHVCT